MYFAFNMEINVYRINRNQNEKDSNNSNECIKN